ncbi:MAG TPA: aldo/keto reductase, partial [Nitrospirota bacterium]|nr:aldo/keto reductase [Nitrospirota bacterium]
SDKDLSKSVRGHGIKDYMNERGFRILKALDQVAKQYHSTPSSVAVAWLMARPGISAPIASVTSLEQLNDLVAAIRLQLDQESIGLLTKASDY